MNIQQKLNQVRMMASSIDNGTISDALIILVEVLRELDKRTKKTSNSMTDITELGEAMKFAGPTARSAGVDFLETIAILQTLAESGIRAEQGGTASRRTIAKMAKPVDCQLHPMPTVQVTTESPVHKPDITCETAPLRRPNKTAPDILSLEAELEAWDAASDEVMQ